MMSREKHKVTHLRPIHLRAVEHELTGPLQDPTGALTLRIAAQRIASQLVQRALHDALGLQEPALHSTGGGRVDGLNEVNLLCLYRLHASDLTALLKLRHQTPDFSTRTRELTLAHGEHTVNLP